MTTTGRSSFSVQFRLLIGDGLATGHSCIHYLILPAPAQILGSCQLQPLTTNWRQLKRPHCLISAVSMAHRHLDGAGSLPNTGPWLLICRLVVEGMAGRSRIWSGSPKGVATTILI